MVDNSRDMVDCYVFDVWSGDYDEDVRIADENNANDWDENEYYFVFSELTDALKDGCSITYEQMSHCGELSKFECDDDGYYV